MTKAFYVSLPPDILRMSVSFFLIRSVPMFSHMHPVSSAFPRHAFISIASIISISFISITSISSYIYVNGNTSHLRNDIAADRARSLFRFTVIDDWTRGLDKDLGKALERMFGKSRRLGVAELPRCR